METESTVYARHLVWVLGQVEQCLDEFGEQRLGWRPAEDTNDARAIVTHLVETTRVYALGFGCGQAVTRDRAAEFAPGEVPMAVLAAAARSLASDIERAFAGLDEDRLARRVLPPQELWGTGEPHELSARDAIVEAIRHAGTHLGELRMVKHLALLDRP